MSSEIYVKENESLDNALKRFKRSCAKSGVLADLRKKEYYQSPSVKRRRRPFSLFLSASQPFIPAFCAADEANTCGCR